MPRNPQGRKQYGQGGSSSGSKLRSKRPPRLTVKFQ